MSASTSFLLSSIKIPQSLLHPKSSFLETPLLSIAIRWPPNFSFFRSISIERVSTKLPSSSSSSSSTSVSLQPVEELPPKLQEIVKLFQAVQEPKAKYEQLLFYGRNLTPLDAQFKTVENKVQGCVSQVWVRAYLDSDKNVVFEADSDSVLTKGLAALLVQGLSGRPVEEILRVSPDFAMLLGLQRSLTPSRNNGFLNMLKLMQKKALQLFVDSEKGAEKLGNAMGTENPVEDSDSSSNFGNGIGELKAGMSSEWEAKDSASKLGSRGVRIKQKLERELRPTELQVEDISYQHAGHEGVRLRSSDGETHFNVRVVSKEFEGKSSVKRHRLIYAILQDELQSGLHALSIVAKTPSEVDTR